MSVRTTPVPEQLHRALRKELLRLAQQEEEMAAREAQQVHYWECMPVAVTVHRESAAALRAAADDLPIPGHAQPRRG